MLEHTNIKYSGINSRHTFYLYEYIIYRDKVEHKYFVIHMLVLIMYTDLLYFYNLLVYPNKYLITLKSVGKHR